MLSPHSPRAAPPKPQPHTRRAQHRPSLSPTLAAISTAQAPAPHSPQAKAHAPQKTNRHPAPGTLPLPGIAPPCRLNVRFHIGSM